jgi:pSer/pThr/pTyr-binding forkhead associated (FHA) protein
MAKLIYSLDGAFLGEYPIEKERMTIGRRATNDIHIDNLGVSGEHASILTIGNDSFLEDLDSTNGTLVNGKPIKKHVLQNADVIEFGKFQLKYVNEQQASSGTGSGTEDFEKTMILRPSYMKAQTPAPVVTAAPPAAPVFSAPSPVAEPAIDTPSSLAAEAPVAAAKPAPAAEATIVGSIQVLNGPSTGKELILNKALTTLGKPGVQVAVITKRPQGYFITHVEGQNFPLVNGESVGAQAHALNDHDVIELAGVKMEFYLSK